HDLGLEVLLGNRQSCPGVSWVVGIDRLNRRLDVVQRRECKQTLSRRKHVSEPGVLGDHRPARRQIGRASIAEPSGSEPYVLILGNRELASRSADVVPIGAGVAREGKGVSHVPAVLFEQRAVLRGCPRKSQFEGLPGPRRELEKLQEFLVLAPAVGLAAEPDVTPLLPPVTDRRVALTFHITPVAPEVNDHGLMSRLEGEVFGNRKQTVRLAVILAEGEIGAMRAEVINR